MSNFNNNCFKEYITTTTTTTIIITIIIIIIISSSSSSSSNIFLKSDLMHSKSVPTVSVISVVLEFHLCSLKQI